MTTLIISSRSCRLADFTIPPLPAAIEGYVVGGWVSQRVPLAALVGKLGRVPAQGVLLICDRLQMFWTYARTVATQMVQLETMWNRADKKLIACAMSKHCTRTPAARDLAVSTCGSALPNPASVSEFDLGDQSLKERCTLLRHLGLILRGDMRQAVSPALPLSIVPRKEVPRWLEV